MPFAAWPASQPVGVVWHLEHSGKYGAYFVKCVKPTFRVLLHS